jgi:aminopeptidase N
VQFRENPAAYLNRVQVDKAQLLEHDQFGHRMESVGPVWMGDRLGSSESPRAYSVVVYNKGGYILHMLRMMMLDTTNKDPDHYFKGLMQDFCQTYDNKAASTEDFKAVVEKHMGKWMDIDGNHRMDWFFKQYVYGTGIPHYGLKYEARMMDGKFTVVGTLTQSGVPEGWKDIVPIYIHLKGRDVRVGWLTVMGKTTPLKFVLPTSVDKVSINDDEDMLMVVEKVM